MSNNPNEALPEIGRQLQKTPIAIIGMASIFAQAKNLTEYWDNILNKINAVTDVPEDRWKIDDYYDPDPSAPDKSYCKRGAFLPDIDFDPAEFGLPPNILEVTDVSQLLSLVVARDALEDAGYGEERAFSRATTGCILGVVGVSSKIYVPLTARLQYPVWERVLKASGVNEADTQKIIEKFKLAYVKWEENSFPGSLTNVVSGRIANRFDLGGTNCVLDAACATSMAAIKMAIMELCEGRADMMLTGGVDTDNSIGVYMSFSKTPAFSKGQSVRAFDAESDGMMAGEGIGMVVLKRLADAERDGDRVYAVIRGVGSSSDGRFKSIYAPRPGGQSVALERAYDEAGYSPATVGLIEAHGTGTPAGDPAEFQGLNATFSQATDRRQFIALGSVKSQIAHTKGAAGVAGLMKISLALYHKILPATINVKKPNPKLHIENSPFYLNTETRPWFRHASDIPRRAGVSSFGFGGTNFHLAVEEHEDEHSKAYRTQSVPRTILLAGSTPAELLTLGRDVLAKFSADKTGLFFNQIADQSDGLNPAPAHARLGFVAASASEASELLQYALTLLQQKPGESAWEHPKGIYFRSAAQPAGKVVALFSGQGSQYLEMGRELAINFPPIRKSFASLDDLFLKDGLKPLSSRIYPPPVFSQEERDRLSEELTRTELAQPAIGGFSVGLYQLLEQAGLRPDFVAGHSFGELTALWAAGVISQADYYLLAKARGKAMSPPSDPDFDAGSMLAVKGDALQVKDQIQQFPDIVLANWNSNDQIVLAGPKAAILEVQKFLAEKGYSVIPLPVSAAFHTPLVGHAQEPFVQAIETVEFSTPKIPLYSNSSGKAHANDPAVIKKAMEDHMLNPVLFKDEIENIYAEGGYFFIEFGPKNVLTNLVKSILADRPHVAVGLNASPKKDSDRQLREAVVQLRVAGLPLSGFDPYQAPRKAGPQRKKSPVTVVLNGSNYVSPKTKAAFENALKDGFKITPEIEVKEVVKEVIVEKVVQTAAPQSAQPSPAQASSLPAAPSSMQFADQLQQHQSEVLRLHEQYLRNEETFAGIYAKLSEQQIALLGGASPERLGQLLPILETLERSMARFQEHQAETLRVHSAYLKAQEDVAANLARLAQNLPAAAAPVIAAAPQVGPARAAAAPAPAIQPVAQPAAAPARAAPPAASPAQPQPSSNGAKQTPAPVTVAAASASAQAYSADQLTAALLRVVSEKTGYPVEMLELDTDMEADLGIDSIKRVEILGALRTEFPSLPKADPDAFAEVRTLGQTVQYMLSSAPAANSESAGGLQSAPVQVPAPAAPSTAYSNQELTAALLRVVSEKTGYPIEMLELDTDIEADLGIDSIKRVEILGALRTEFPNLPKADPDAFAEVRTLGQTVQYMLSSAPNAAGEPAASLPAGPAPAAATAPAASASYSKQELTEALLRVVSEKTGYPVEMLELDTDMEADLGIDSIKRVEILGALRTEFPNLPKADPDAFAEVRTLGQTVQYMLSSAPAGQTVQTEIMPEEPAPKTAPVALPATAGIDPNALSAALLRVVSEKTGYPVEMLELDTDMEADLGIDSIKRVEILGALRTEFPNLPKADPEAFAEVRTLGQIIDYLSNGASLASAEPVQSEEASDEPQGSSFPRGIVSLKPIPQPDYRAYNLPAGRICLLSDNGTAETAEVAQALLERGWKVAVLSFPGEIISPRPSLPVGVQRFALSDMREETLQQQLDAIAGQAGPIGAFIHLNPPHTAASDDEIYSPIEKQIIKHVFLIAKHLKEPLRQSASAGSAAFLVIAHLDGKFGMAGEVEYSPVSAGLFGLVKTVNLEWESVYCRGIDISPRLGQQQTGAIVAAELFDPNRRLAEVAYSPDGRATLVIDQAEKAAA